MKFFKFFISNIKNIFTSSRYIPKDETEQAKRPKHNKSTQNYQLISIQQCQNI